MFLKEYRNRWHRVLVAMSACLVFASGARAQSGYTYSRTITIDHTKIPNTDQANFPFQFSTTDALLKSTVHLVNLNNPMMMKGPLREIIPAPAQRVRVRLPEGVRAKAVHLLVAGTLVKARHSGRDITLDIPSIRVHEVVAIDL